MATKGECNYPNVCTDTAGPQPHTLHDRERRETTSAVAVCAECLIYSLRDFKDYIVIQAACNQSGMCYLSPPPSPTCPGVWIWIPTDVSPMTTLKTWPPSDTHSIRPPDTVATLEERVRIVFLNLAGDTLGNIILHTNLECRNEWSSSWEIDSTLSVSTEHLLQFDPRWDVSIKNKLHASKIVVYYHLWMFKYQFKFACMPVHACDILSSFTSSIHTFFCYVLWWWLPSQLHHHVLKSVK